MNTLNTKPNSQGKNKINSKQYVYNVNGILTIIQSPHLRHHPPV